MKESINITILDPKVKGLLQELQHLKLIEIDDSNVKQHKQDLIDKLDGINLKDIDTNSLQNIIDKR